MDDSDLDSDEQSVEEPQPSGCSQASQPSDSQMSTVFSWSRPSQCVPTSVPTSSRGNNTRPGSSSTVKKHSKRKHNVSRELVKSDSDDSSDEQHATSTSTPVSASQPSDSQVSMVFSWPRPSQCVPASVPTSSRGNNVQPASSPTVTKRSKRKHNVSRELVESNSDDSSDEQHATTNTNTSTPATASQPSDSQMSTVFSWSRPSQCVPASVPESSRGYNTQLGSSSTVLKRSKRKRVVSRALVESDLDDSSDEQHATSTSTPVSASQPPDSQMSTVFSWPRPTQWVPTSVSKRSKRKRVVSRALVESDLDDSSDEQHATSSRITKSKTVSKSKLQKRKKKTVSKTVKTHKKPVAGQRLPKPSDIELEEISPELARQIAMLHADNKVCRKVFMRKKEQYKAAGITWRTGGWSAEEDARLRHNFCKFFQEHEVDDPNLYRSYAKVPDLKRDEKKEIKKNIEDWGFYTALGYGIHRPLHVIYSRARDTLHPLVSAGKFTDAEKEQLKELMSEHGQQWSVIGKIMNRDPVSCRGVGRHITRQNENTKSGSWSNFEDEKLVRRMFSVAGINAWMDPKIKLPFAIIAEDFKRRTYRQIEDRWLLQLQYRCVVAMDHSDRREDVSWSREEKIDLCNVICDQNCANRGQIDWTKVASEMGRYNTRFLQVKFSEILKHNVPNTLKATDNLHAMMRHIEEKVFPKWTKNMHAKFYDKRKGISMKDLRKLLKKLREEGTDQGNKSASKDRIEAADSVESSSEADQDNDDAAEDRIEAADSVESSSEADQDNDAAAANRIEAADSVESSSEADQDNNDAPEDRIEAADSVDSSPEADHGNDDTPEEYIDVEGGIDSSSDDSDAIQPVQSQQISSSVSLFSSEHDSELSLHSYKSLDLSHAVRPQQPHHVDTSDSDSSCDREPVPKEPTIQTDQSLRNVRNSSTTTDTKGSPRPSSSSVSKSSEPVIKTKLSEKKRKKGEKYLMVKIPRLEDLLERMGKTITRVDGDNTRSSSAYRDGLSTNEEHQENYEHGEHGSGSHGEDSCIINPTPQTSGNTYTKLKKRQTKPVKQDRTRDENQNKLVTSSRSQMGGLIVNTWQAVGHDQVCDEDGAFEGTKGKKKKKKKKKKNKENKVKSKEKFPDVFGVDMRLKSPMTYSKHPRKSFTSSLQVEGSQMLDDSISDS